MEGEIVIAELICKDVLVIGARLRNHGNSIIVRGKTIGMPERDKYDWYVTTETVRLATEIEKIIFNYK